ncbi:leucine-rich repeat protein 2-like [Carya illinoinensis]|uniref:leucine-rich repeat protein 2-like n=1 Tax=Carya illinoinensis TaxID=32201 RepID=UPI001C718E0E|nr:leucine-rich repeat protein 2-like [Carya illinoinensis]
MADPTSFLFLLSMMLLLLQSYLFSFANAEILNVTTDKSALFELKAHISSKDSHHVLISNWSSNTHICTWVGVTCGSKHLRVKALNLSYMDLNEFSGALPEIGNLTMLRALFLYENNFEGTIPSSLLKCTQLQYLDMWNNNFTGRLSPEIGNLTMLTYLYLAQNKFEGMLIISLVLSKYTWYICMIYI